MNIKELMEWRQDCFFCHKELTLFSEISGDRITPCFIKNDWFVIESKFINLSIHVETGEIVLSVDALEQEKDKILVDQILKSDLKIVHKCLSCIEYNNVYQYYGTISLTSFIKTAEIILFTETVVFNNWALTQKIISKNGEAIIYFRKAPEYKMSLKNTIKVPFIDLKKITPDKLELKIKTYIVFS